jgi:hypothetical protein
MEEADLKLKALLPDRMDAGLVLPLHLVHDVVQLGRKAMFWSSKLTPKLTVVGSTTF